MFFKNHLYAFGVEPVFGGYNWPFALTFWTIYRSVD